jgi:hypothetical protein
MDNLRPGGVTRRPSPQLPAFCRMRRPITTTVRVTTLQLSTLLLILAGPVPAPVRPVATALVLPPSGPMSAAQIPSAPTPFQP